MLTSMTTTYPSHNIVQQSLPFTLMVTYECEKESMQRKKTSPTNSPKGQAYKIIFHMLLSPFDNNAKDLKTENQTYSPP